MKYISIGAVMTEGTEHILDITHGGNSFRLTGEKATVWLNGRYRFATVATTTQAQFLQQLIKMGLAIACDGSGAEEYRALTMCTIVPAEHKHPYWFLKPVEQTVLKWLRNAGLVLSMAELVYLIDRDIPLEDRFLGKENAQTLVEQIYTKDTVFNNILENQMERAGARDAVVCAVLELLRKKRIVLL